MAHTTPETRAGAVRAVVVVWLVVVVIGGATLAAAVDGRSRTGTADPELDAQVFALSQKGLAAYYNDDYDEAIARFEELTRLDPESPNGWVFQAGTWQGMMEDYRTRAFAAPFRRSVEQGITLARRRIESGLGADRAWQYLGAAYGYRGIFEAMQGGWWGAFRDGQSAWDALREAQALRPDVADVDYGLGMYLYWRTVKAS
jgi:tetratricopeptide (TPR) repeat protein